MRTRVKENGDWGMSDMMLCEPEADANESPEYTVIFTPQKGSQAKVIQVRNSVGKIDLSKITQSVSQYKEQSRSYQRADVTEIFFVACKADPIIRWHPAVKGAAKDFAGILKPHGEAVKAITRDRLEEVIEGMRDRME